MGHGTSKHGHSKDQHPSSKAGGYPSTRPPASNVVPKYDLSNFAVITVVFNPIKYKSRYEHYQNFESHMSQSGVNLITVECIFESAPHFGLPRQNFEVTRSGDRRHIQLIAPSIIWLKENLINIAIQRLPQNIEYIAWIDADIEFDRLDWPYLTINELQRYPIVQLFELSFFLGPGGKKDILRRDYSFGYSIRHNKPIEPKRFNDWYAHPGYAWAMRRSAYNMMGGLLDFCIIGSGDLHFAFALLRRIEETIRPSLHADYRRLAIAWGDKVAQIAQNGANVGYVPVNIWHFWHGERSDRNYVDRWAILEKHNFSPLNDLEKNDDNGLLRLADKKHFGRPEQLARMEAFERDIVEYFKSRNEDKTVKSNQAQRPPPTKTKPFVAPRTQPNRNAAFKPPRIPSSRPMGGISRPHIWSSGPAGIHVDDHDPYWNQCCCPGHHHQPDNHDCPCSSHHADDQHCWDTSDHQAHHHHHDDQYHHDNEHHYPDQYHHGDNDHHHHHHHDDHHHHHTDDYSGGHHSSHDHSHHGGWDHGDHSGGHCDYSSGGGGGGYDYSSGGGGGYSHNDYGGPGSFY